MTTTRTERVSTDDGIAIIEEDPVVTIPRRSIDKVLIAFGAVAAVVFFVAAGLLWWGATFADDYVYDELSSQNIFFPDEASLTEEGRDDLVPYAEEQVTTGPEAEAYASFIDGHLVGIADGLTYAELGAIEREAEAEVEAAVEAGAPEDEIADLEAAAAAVSGQRDSLFRGETLRGLLLSAFAWSTIGRIAGIAALVALAAGVVMTALVIGGLVHISRKHT
jgi:hypothetical protein